MVGTVSIEKSERLSKLLQRQKIRHVVLNAKYHEREAEIVAQAGRKSAVTIATNMAGRGTDIVLGGYPDGLARIEANPAQDPEAHRQAVARYRELCAAEKKEVSRYRLAIEASLQLAFKRIRLAAGFFGIAFFSAFGPWSATSITPRSRFRSRKTTPTATRQPGWSRSASYRPSASPVSHSQSFVSFDAFTTTR